MRSKRKYSHALLSGVLTFATLFSMVSVATAQHETWISKTGMPTARWGASACLADGKIYVLGGAGKDKNSPYGTIEVYDPGTNAWVAKADMPIPNYFFSASLVNGKIYIIGGAEREWGFKASVEEYDPVSETWTSKKDMPTPRSAHAARVVDGVIYVIGGQQGESILGLQTVEAYNPATDVWTQKKKMPTARSWLATSVVDGMIYAIGGTDALPASQISHVSGFGGARVAALVVDSTQFTQNGYRVTFNDTLFDDTVYDVLNSDTGEKIIENAAHKLDGVTPGPLFDGLRLLIKDYDPARIDLENTGWHVGASEWQADIAVTDLTSGFEVIKGYAHPADYKITLFENVADTSAAMFGLPAIPMSFRVRNLTEDRKAAVVFVESVADQQLSRNDRIIILEPQTDGELSATWTILFSGSDFDAPPQPDDEFVFKTRKPLTSEDVYEVNAIATSVESRGDDLLPRELTLLMNYPNPFNPSTTITYDLPRAQRIEIAVYNVLGERVVTLTNGRQQAGRREVHWGGRDGGGKLVGSGAYFSRLITGNESISRKMLLMK